MPPHIPMWMTFLILYFTGGALMAFLDKVGLFCFISTGMLILILVCYPQVFPNLSILFMSLPWWMKAIFGFGSYFLPHFAWGGLLGSYSVWTKPKKN